MYLSNFLKISFLLLFCFGPKWTFFIIHTKEGLKKKKSIGQLFLHVYVYIYIFVDFF